MKKAIALLLLAVAPLSYADPLACDGDSNEAQAEQRDYCSAHPGCWLVVGMMKSCEKAKAFFGSLGSPASSGRSAPSDEQVLGALSSSSGKSRGLSACVTELDAEACKRALGFGGAAAAEPEPAELAQAPAGSESASRALTKDGARRLRSAAIDAGDKARSDIRLSCDKPQLRVDHEGCVFALGQLDQAIATGERLNRDPEYLAHLPAFEVEGLAYAQRLGWNKRNGQWVNEGFDARIGKCEGLRRSIEDTEDADRAQARKLFGEFKTECAQAHEQYQGRIAGWESKLGSGGSSSPGLGAPTAADCARIQGRIEAVLSTQPAEEPTELSFYEAECGSIDAAASQRAQQWRRGLAQAGATAAAPAPPVAEMEALDQWDQQQDETVAEELREIAGEQAAEQAQQMQAQGPAQTPSPAALASYTAGGAAPRSNGPPPNKRPGWKPPSCEEFGTAVDRVLLNHPFLMHPDNKGMPHTETYILMRKRMLNLEQSQGACASRPDLQNSLVQALESDKQRCRSMLSHAAGDCENGRDPGGILPEVESAIAEVNGDREKTPDSSLYLSCRSKMSDISSRSTSYFLESRKNGALSSLHVFAWRDYQTLKLLEGECRSEPRLARRIEVQRVISERSADECSKLTAGGDCQVDREPGR